MDGCVFASLYASSVSCVEMEPNLTTTTNTRFPALRRQIYTHQPAGTSSQPNRNGGNCTHVYIQRMTHGMTSFLPHD